MHPPVEENYPLWSKIHPLWSKIHPLLGGQWLDNSVDDDSVTCLWLDACRRTACACPQVPWPLAYAGFVCKAVPKWNPIWPMRTEFWPVGAAFWLIGAVSSGWGCVLCLVGAVFSGSLTLGLCSNPLGLLCSPWCLYSGPLLDDDDWWLMMDDDPLYSGPLFVFWSIACKNNWWWMMMTDECWLMIDDCWWWLVTTDWWRTNYTKLYKTCKKLYIHQKKHK